MHDVLASYVERGELPGLVSVIERRDALHVDAISCDPNAYPIQREMDETGVGAGPPDPEKYPDAERWMRDLGSLPLVYQPGEVWMYNTGAEVLGVLIARASGQSFGEFLAERIFEPLG